MLPRCEIYAIVIRFQLFLHTWLDGSYLSDTEHAFWAWCGFLFFLTGLEGIFAAAPQQSVLM